MATQLSLDRTGGRPSLLRRYMSHPLGVVSVAFLILMLVCCIGAPLIAPYPPNAQDLAHTLNGPSGLHWLGTDQLGRDVLSRLLYGGVVSFVGIGEVLGIALLVGLPLGLIAGYRGGWVDNLLARLADLGLAIPALIILLTVFAVFANGETAAMCVFGLILSPALFRVVRSAVIAVRSDDYLAAARVAGLTGRKIIRRHLIARVTGPLVVNCSVIAAVALVVQSGLSFLGLSVAPPAPSWGGSVADAQSVIQEQPWLLVPTGGVIALTVLAMVLAGDALRDSLEEGWSSSRGRSRRRRRAASVALRPQVVTTDDGLIEVQNALCKVRGLSIGLREGGYMVPLVANVSFDIGRAEAVGLVGESGCGKTLTALAILGLLPGAVQVTAGSCELGGVDTLALSAKQLARHHGTDVSYIAQKPGASLDPVFTVGSQLSELVRRHRKLSKAEARNETLELLSMVRLPSPELIARRYPYELSGGMAQRVSIACALAGNPRLLIADEPTTALDVTVQAEILDLLRSLQGEREMALLFISHDWGVIADVCDRAVVLYAGEVVESGPVAPLVEASLHPYTRALVRANPQFAVAGQPFPSIPGTVPTPGQWPVGCHFASRCELVADACTTGPILLEMPVAGRATRCIHHEALAQRELT